MPKIYATSSLEAITGEFSRPDVHIGAGEHESPFVPFIENVYIRHLAFDVRNGAFANILWVKKGGKLGAIGTAALFLPARWRAVGVTLNMIGSQGREATCGKIPEQFTRWFQTTPTA